jgi:hypothetical protein
MSNVASVYLARKQFAQAEKGYRDVLQTFARTISPDNVNIGISRVRLGLALMGEMRFQDAEGELLAGYQILLKQEGASSRNVQKARQYLATVYTALGQTDKAAKFRSELAANK